MRTAFVIGSISRNAGGAFTSVRRLAQELHASPNRQVDVLAIEDEYSKEDLARWAPVHPSVFPLHGPKSFSYAPEMGRQLARLDLELVHTQGLWMYPSVATLRWAHRTRKPYLVSVRGMLDPWALQNSRWKKRLASWLYENAHLHGAACLHALNDAETQCLRAYGLRNPICVIPNGVDLPDGAQSRRPSWASIVPDGVKVLLYLGRLHSKKGLSNLLRAWDLAGKRGPNRLDHWHLVIAGWNQGGHETKLRALSRQLGIQDQVHFIGPQFGADKPATYRCANAFILPSLSEGLPMVVLEAWSYGLPVIITPHCNLPEGSQAGAALCVDSNPSAIARGLNLLFSMTADERKALGMRGRQLVQTHYCWTKVVPDMISVYEWVLGGGTQPACIVTA